MYRLYAVCEQLEWLGHRITSRQLQHITTDVACLVELSGHIRSILAFSGMLAILQTL